MSFRVPTEPERLKAIGLDAIVVRTKADEERLKHMLKNSVVCNVL